MKCLFATLLSFAGIQLIFALYGCKLDEIAKIAGVDSAEGGLPENEQGLKDQCRTMTRLQERMIKLAKECPSTEEIRNIISYLEDTLKTYRNLCTTGTKMNIAYLENAKCLIELTKTRVADACEDIVSPEDSYEVNTCRINYMLNGCVFKTVYDKCGEDATYVAKTFLKPSMDFQKKNCCSKGSSRTNPVNLHFF